MDLGILGKTALVTGGSKGMGYASACHLAAEGARLILFARTKEPLEDAADSIRKQHGAEVLALAGDMRNVEDIANLKEETIRFCGGPDIVVLNTGIPPSPLREVLDEIEDQRWQDAHDIQLGASIKVVNAMVPLMMERKWGRLIAITSASAKAPMPVHGLSTVYRAGQTAYLKHLANEIAHSGVTVNMVGPASIETPTFLTYHRREDREKIVPLGRLGKPEELAALVVYLSSVHAGFITGQHIQFDGGMTASLF